MRSILFFLLFLQILLPTAVLAGAEQVLSERQKALIDLARLPEFHLSFSFSYDVADFDVLLQGSRSAKIAALQHTLDSRETVTIARAEANDDIADLLSNDDRAKDTSPYRTAAVRFYEEALEQGPRTATLLYRAGRARLHRGTAGDEAAARNRFLEALKADPDFCLPYREMMISASESFLQEAENCFQRAADRTGASAEDLYRLHEFRVKASALGFFGIAMGSVSAPQAARDEAGTFTRLMDAVVNERSLPPLVQAARREPKNVKYQASLGAFQAFRLFQEIMKRSTVLMPSTSPPEALLTAATETATANKDLLREVQERFRLVDLQAPDAYPAVYAFWSVPLLMEGKYEQAEQKLLKAIRLDPRKDSYTQTLLVLYLSWPGAAPSPEELSSRFTTMLAKKCADRCSTNEQRMLAQIWFDDGRYGDVEKQLRAARTRDEQSLTVRTGLAVALLKQLRFQEAFDEMVAARQYLPGASDKDQAHFCSLSAVLLLLTGDEQGALQWLEQAYALNPNDPVTAKLVVKRET